MSLTRVLLVDHRDSFVFNLHQAIGTLAGVAARVVRYDAVDVEAVAAWKPERIVLSPGPGDPSDPAWFGSGAALVHRLGASVPILGVCLGHQGIATAFGARLVRSPRPVFGHAHPIHHEGQGLFQGLPSPLEGMRYHALVVDPGSLPAELVPTAWTEDGLLMGLQHRRWPVHGLQFHPESYATPQGDALLRRFLEAPW